MQLSNINRYISTFNLVLIIVGYPLLTTLFLPNYVTHDSSEADLAISRLVTVPYRASILAISLVVIILNWNKRLRMSTPMKLYFLFWALLSVRIFYDLLLRTDLIIDPTVKQNQIIYAYFVCFIPAIAVYRGLDVIDYELAYRWMLFGIVLLIPALAYNTPTLFTTIGSEFRLTGNISLNPIALGHVGVLIALMGLVKEKQKATIWQIVFFCLLFLIGCFIVLRSSSRGPLVTMIGILAFYLFARSKTLIVSSLWIIVLVLTILFFGGFFSDFVREVSPLMADRLVLSKNEDWLLHFSTGRTGLYEMAVDKFVNHPVFGDSYALVFPDGITYSHNVVLDAFMGLGFLGGMIFVFILLFGLLYSFRIVRFYRHYCWVGLLCVSYIIRHMFSGSFYQSVEFNSILLLILGFHNSLSSTIQLKKFPPINSSRF